ncbi:MAG: hypothetical protein ACRBCL_00830 [Maritimibacter sp.]
MFESHFIAMICAVMFAGEAEVTHAYQVGYDLHRIRTDCETSETVIEVGRDVRSSLDSLQQVLFAAEVTGKTPLLVIVDTDGRIGAYEHRIRVAAERVGVTFQLLHQKDIIAAQLRS